MARPDEAHRLTDAELAKLERRIASVYKAARDDLQQTVDEYFEAFKTRDAEMKKAADEGKVTKEYYKQWRMNQIARGKRFEALRDKMAQRYTQANETAISYVNDATPGIYSLNRNYTAYTIDRATGGALTVGPDGQTLNADFTLYDEQTVKRLIMEEPDVMPHYPPARAVKRGIDLAYGKSQITKNITSGILRGLGIKEIADNLQERISTMERTSAIRAARTAMTTAQNAGRQDSYEAAAKMGIHVRKRWIATKDHRTRHDHGAADGQIVEHDQPFNVGGYDMMFPGDQSGGAPGWLIYNCRCTMGTAEKDGIEAEPRMMRLRDANGRNVVVPEMTYKEWKEWVRTGKLPEKTGQKPLANGSGRGIISTGEGIMQTGGKETGGKQYPLPDEATDRDVQAAEAYRKISRVNDTEVIARNSGFSVEDIVTIKRHVFFEKHKTYDGYKLLQPDYDMAVAWKRLREGCPEERDILLLRHELLESQIEKERNCSLSEAHAEAKKKFNWEEALLESVGEEGEPDGLL